jgi:precorrin-6B methylase 2
MSDYALTLSDVEIARYQWMAERAHGAESDLWAAAGIREGAVVADVGCGPGAVSARIAAIVGSTGQVWAVDQNEGALAAAAELAGRLGHDNVRTQHGEAGATRLDPASMDVVVMRHVLAHNGGREQAVVDHLVSLVKPGGCIYLVDVDLTAARVNPPVDQVEDLRQHYIDFQTARGNDMSAGLRLGELLQAAGTEVLDYRGYFEIAAPPPGFRPPAWAAREMMVEAGLATPEDVERWGAAFDQFDRGDFPGLTNFIPIFCAIGRRPTIPPGQADLPR